MVYVLRESFEHEFAFGFVLFIEFLPLLKDLLELLEDHGVSEPVATGAPLCGVDLVRRVFLDLAIEVDTITRGLRKMGTHNGGSR